MFERFSGRSFLLVHASLGLVFFAYTISVQANKYVELSGRQLNELIAAEDKAMIQQEQMKSASNLSLVFSSAFFFLMSVWLMTHQTEMNFGLVQRSALGKRLDFCLTLSLYICFFSALFNAIQLMDDDNLTLTNADGEETVLDLGRPMEWMLTCPLMQLAIPILAGEKVPDHRRISMPIAAFTVLVFGLLSTLASDIVLKSLLYCAGFLIFLVMLGMMNACIMDASSGGENLLYGSSFLRGLIVVIALTWIPFPIWYALSPEGFNVIKDEAAMKLAVAFLNVFSKGAFIMYLARIRSDHEMRQKTMLSVGYLKDVSQSEFDGLDGVQTHAGTEKETVDKITNLLIKEVLESMGRSKDQDHVVELLQSLLITSNDDILSLTKEYCREVDLPWGLIIALKSKIRSFQVQSDDAWSMQALNGPRPEISFSAPHIAKNEVKLRAIIRRQSKDFADDASEAGHSVCGSATGRSAQSTAPSSLAMPGRAAMRKATSGADDEAPYPMSPRGPMTFSSQLSATSPARGDPEEVAKLSALVERNQREVSGQVDECREFVVQSMDKIMDMLEQRLNAENKPKAPAFGAA
jgi:bacteriorhodopsin